MSCQNSEGVFSVVLSKHNELDTLIITLCSSKMGRKTSECLGSVQSGLKAVRPTHMIAHLPTCSCTAVHALAMVTCVCSTLKKATRDMDQQMMQCRTWPLLASFPGSARDAYNISSCENGAFLLVETTVCCRFYYWSEIEVIRTKIVVQSAYTSAIAQSLLKWNGYECDGSMHYAFGFYCCSVTTFWKLIGTANFQAAEVTVWTRGSCQAISPTAWERR